MHRIFNLTPGPPGGTLNRENYVIFQNVTPPSNVIYIIGCYLSSFGVQNKLIVVSAQITIKDYGKPFGFLPIKYRYMYLK